MPEIVRVLGRARFGAPAPELGSFELGEPAGRYSRDGLALLVPKLQLAPDVVRAVSRSKSLFTQLNGVSMLVTSSRFSRIEREVWSFVWGDIEVFLNGSPTVRRTVFLRGRIEMPNLDTVMRYVHELPKATGPGLSAHGGS